MDRPFTLLVGITQYRCFSDVYRLQTKIDSLPLYRSIVTLRLLIVSRKNKDVQFELVRKSSLALRILLQAALLQLNVNGA